MPTKVTVAAKGIQGAPGVGEATAAYVHEQTTPSGTWVVMHNLGYRPNVTVIDQVGDEVEGQIAHLSSTELRLTFSAALAGAAYLS